LSACPSLLGSELLRNGPEAALEVDGGGIVARETIDLLDVRLQQQKLKTRLKCILDRISNAFQTRRLKGF